LPRYDMGATSNHPVGNNAGGTNAVNNGINNAVSRLMLAEETKKGVMHDDEEAISEITPIADTTSRKADERMATSQAQGQGQGQGQGLGQQKKLTLPEAADYMGIGGTTLRRIVRRGELPCLKLSTKQLFLQRDLEAYLQGHYGRMAQPQAPTNHAHAAPPDYLKDSPHLQPKRREP